MTPQLPPGFVLDEAPALPPGFVLDSAKPQMTRGEFIKRELLRSPPVALARGVKDLIDTGAGFMSRLGGADEQARVRTADAAGRAEFDKAVEGQLMPQATRVLGNIAGAGPLVKGAGALVGTVAPRLGAAVGSSGMTTGAAPVSMAAKAGDVAIRSAGGGAAGVLSGGAVNSDDAAFSGMVGAALPGGIAGAGAVGRWIASTAPGQTLANAFRSGGEKAARQILTQLGMDGRSDELIGYLRAAPDLVSGSKPTMAQSLVGTPAQDRAAIYERVVSKTPGGARLLDAYTAQSNARMAALEGVAPTNPLGLAQSKEDLGNAISRYAKVEEGMAKTAGRELYRGVDPAKTSRTVLPVDEMKNAAEKFVGSGAFGQNKDPWEAVAAAQKITTPPASPLKPQAEKWWRQAKTPAEEIVPQGAEWDEVLRLRNSLNARWNEARNMGDDQISSALGAQKMALDARIEKSLPPDMLGRWREANSSWQALQQRFHTGPQAALFQTRNGVPLKQGGESVGLFWNASQGLADDAKAFRRLTQDNPALMGEFKSMVTTEGASTQTKAGQELSARFPQWVDQHITGLREALSPQELVSVQRIADDIKRALKAGVAGKGAGGTSDTFQLGANALNGGFLDSNAAKLIATKVPYAQGLRSWAAETVGAAKAKNAASLMAEPDNLIIELARRGDDSRIGMNAKQRNEFQRLLLRSSPVIAADR